MRDSPSSLSNDGSREMRSSVDAGNIPAKERFSPLRVPLMLAARAAKPPSQQSASAIDGVAVSNST